MTESMKTGQPVVNHRQHQVITSGEVPVQRAGADARRPGDVVEGGRHTVTGKRFTRSVE